MSSVTPHNRNLCLLATPIAQDLHHCSALQRFRSKPQRGHGDANARTSRAPGGFAVVDDNTRMKRRKCLSFAVFVLRGTTQTPRAHAAAFVAVPDEVMRGEIVGLFGATAPCDIVRCRADDPRITKPGLRDVARNARQRPAADRQIDARFGQVNNLVLGTQIELHIGQGGSERPQQWHQTSSHEAHRRADPYAPRATARCGILKTRRECGDTADRNARGVDHLLAVFGQRQRMCRTMQQLQAVGSLKPGDRLRYGRHRETNPAPRLSETASIDDRNKAAQLDERKIGDWRCHHDLYWSRKHSTARHDVTGTEIVSRKIRP